MAVQKEILLYVNSIATPSLDTFFELVTMMGEQYLYTAIISWLYWNSSREKGFLLTLGYLSAGLSNGALKLLFQSPRPFEVMAAIEGKRLHTATGYSFPSGHSQGAAGFFASLAYLIHRFWFTLFAAILILLVALSRVYLRVHWPVDVLFGILFGLATSLPVLFFFRKLIQKRERFLLILSRTTILFSALSLILLILDISGVTESLKMTDFFKILGAAVGGLGGFILQESSRQPFINTAGLSRKVLRWMVGIITATGILIGLKLLFPVSNPFHFLRYLSSTLWITCLYPMIGRKIGLFS